MVILLAQQMNVLVFCEGILALKHNSALAAFMCKFSAGMQLFVTPDGMSKGELCRAVPTFKCLCSGMQCFHMRAKRLVPSETFSTFLAPIRLAAAMADYVSASRTGITKPHGTERAGIWLNSGVDVLVNLIVRFVFKTLSTVYASIWKALVVNLATKLRVSGKKGWTIEHNATLWTTHCRTCKVIIANFKHEVNRQNTAFGMSLQRSLLAAFLCS